MSQMGFQPHGGDILKNHPWTNVHIVHLATGELHGPCEFWSGGSARLPMVFPPSANVLAKFAHEGANFWNNVSNPRTFFPEPHATGQVQFIRVSIFSGDFLASWTPPVA